MYQSITHYLEAARRGEPEANQALLALVYDSLRRIAANRLGCEFRSGDLQPTELVHEAWIRLGGNQHAPWKNRFHFYAAAAEAMRRTLIDNARRRQAAKRGGLGVKDYPVAQLERVTLPLADDLLDLNDALSEFEAEFPLHAQIVKLKYFAGMTTAEIAHITNKSVATMERYWTFARAWLHTRMRD